MGELLYIILCIFLFIGVAITKKERFNAEVNYHTMRMNLEKMRQEQAEQQMSHTRYGK